MSSHRARSPQRVGIEERRTGKGVQYRGTVYDKLTRRRLRGPWTASLAAARAWRIDALDRLTKGLLSGERGPSLHDAIELFLGGIDTGTIQNRSGRPFKPSVVRDYRRDLRNRVAPRIGATRMRELALTDVQRLVDDLRATGLSGSSVRNTIMALRSLYSWGRPRGYALINPCEGVQLPAGGRKRERIAAPAEAARLAAAVTGHERAAFGLACYAGLRAGELLALDWPSVDLDLRVLRVERAWDHGDRMFIEPKSSAARRLIPITERLHRILIEHRALTRGRGLLLPNLRVGPGAATPMSHSALVKRLAKRWRAAGLEPLGLHEARHTFASLLIAAGANAKAITTYMGHSSIQVTFDRYGHLMPGSEAEVAGLLDAYLGRDDGREVHAES